MATCEGRHFLSGSGGLGLGAYLGKPPPPAHPAPLSPCGAYSKIIPLNSRAQGRVWVLVWESTPTLPCRPFSLGLSWSNSKVCSFSPCGAQDVYGGFRPHAPIRRQISPKHRFLLRNWSILCTFVVEMRGISGRSHPGSA